MSPSCTQPDVAQSSAKHLVVVFNVKAQEGSRNRVSVEPLTSGAVMADACCNLSILSLFTSLFSFFLNYLKCYLSNKEIWKEKKNELVVSLHYGLCQSFLRKNVLCVLFPCRKKKSLLSVEIIQIFSFTVVWFLLILKKVFSSLLSWEKPKSMHFSGSCKRDVCLFDNTSKSVTGWDLKSTKNAGFPISTTDCTYAFCTSGIFYTGD